MVVETSDCCDHGVHWDEDCPICTEEYEWLMDERSYFGHMPIRPTFDTKEEERGER